MKKSFFTTCMLKAALLLMTLLCSTQVVRATDFITDVMVIGHDDKTEIAKLQSDYEKQGWTAINKDLNAGCGTGTDYIYLLYKKQSSSGSSGKPITGFYIKTGKNPPSSLTHEGRTYHKVSYKGSDNFVKGYGDLNNNAEGDYIYLYYTKDPSPDYNAVTGISFNGTQGGAIGANGSTTGYSLNAGTKGDVIYMHVNVARAPVELISSTAEVTLLDGDVVFGKGGKETHVIIPAGATVTLNGVDITNITNNDSHQWAGITCLGDGVIILADGTANKVRGGGYSAGIFVPKNYTLTIRGNGSLDVHGAHGSAGIGCNYGGSCGNITIDSGTIAATGGDYSAGIGSGNGNEASCSNITITGGNITAKGGFNGAGIGCGKQGSCVGITISGGNIKATGGIDGPGIGSGNEGFCSNISISGGTITTMGNTHGAGIGSGRGGSFNNISISGGIIIATSYYYGAGIGSGYSSSCGDITISGGIITATGGFNGAGIGSGPDSSCGDIVISEDVTRISATEGENHWAIIGPGKDGSCGNVTIAPSLIDVIEGSTRNIWSGFVPSDNADNTASISKYADSKKHDTQLRDRKLYRDGSWNTLCLPFDLDDFRGTPLEGFTVMEVDTETAHEGHKTGYDPTDLAYHINFKTTTGIKAGKPYIVKLSPDLVISSADDWNAFAAAVEKGTTYEGKVVYLAEDITVSTMVGTSDHRFMGLFDGQGHQLTLDNLQAKGQYCAPFRYVDGATIKYLHTAGSLTSADKYISGLIGECRGKVNIRNCWSSVAINSSVNGDGTHGGFIGEVKSGGNVVINRCLFDGSFIGSNTNCWGGFVGWSQGNTTITNCAFMPEDIKSLDSSGSMTFGRNKVTTENCYYSVALGDAQGTAVGDMNEAQLAAALGIGWKNTGDKVEPFMTVGSGYVTNPVFYGVTVKNVTPATVASTDGTVSFSGSFKPVALGSYEYTRLFLGDNNTLHFPTAKMDIGSFRASFQLAISKMGDVNNDGGVSLEDLIAMVNYILGIPNDNPNDIFIFERADLDNSKDISLADILLVVDIILNENQDNNVKVYTGSTPITYGSGGKGDIR